MDYTDGLDLMPVANMPRQFGPARFWTNIEVSTPLKAWVN